MNINEVINICFKYQITFEQFFILYFISKQDEETLIKYISINEQWDQFLLKSLEEKKLITKKEDVPEGSYPMRKLIVSSEFLKDINMKKQKDNISEWLDEWYNLFPSGIKSAGYYVRTDPKGCGRKLSKFMINYPEFDKDIILKATKNYVIEMKNRGYDRMMLAPNFIEKNKISTLYGYCENLLNSQDIEDDWNVIKV